MIVSVIPAVYRYKSPKKSPATDININLPGFQRPSTATQHLTGDRTLIKHTVSFYLETRFPDLATTIGYITFTKRMFSCTVLQPVYYATSQAVRSVKLCYMCKLSTQSNFCGEVFVWATEIYECMQGLILSVKSADLKTVISTVCAYCL